MENWMESGSHKFNQFHGKWKLKQKLDSPRGQGEKFPLFLGFRGGPEKKLNLFRFSSHDYPPTTPPPPNVTITSKCHDYSQNVTITLKMS